MKGSDFDGAAPPVDRAAVEAFLFEQHAASGKIVDKPNVDTSVAPSNEASGADAYPMCLMKAPSGERGAAHPHSASAAAVAKRGHGLLETTDQQPKEDSVARHARSIVGGESSSGEPRDRTAQSEAKERRDSMIQMDVLKKLGASLPLPTPPVSSGGPSQRGKPGKKKQHAAAVCAWTPGNRPNSIAGMWQAAISGVQAMPRWQQGDAELNTKENMAKRRALRRDPEVLEALAAWWLTAQRSMHPAPDGT